MTKRIDDVRRAAEKDLANIKQTLQFAQNKVSEFRIDPKEVCILWVDRVNKNVST